MIYLEFILIFCFNSIQKVKPPLIVYTGLLMRKLLLGTSCRFSLGIPGKSKPRVPPEPSLNSATYILYHIFYLYGTIDKIYISHTPSVGRLLNVPSSTTLSMQISLIINFQIFFME